MPFIERDFFFRQAAPAAASVAMKAPPRSPAAQGR
jgi:hypothetical protein